LKQFKDANGRDWAIDVTVGTMRTVRDLTTVNLYKLFDTEAARIFTDPALLVDVLFALCRDECAKRGVSDVQFGMSMNGDVLEQAGEALVDAVIDFFPQSQRTSLRTLWEKSQAAARTLAAKLAEKVQTIDLTSLLPSGR
jgi:hypothetical protein